MARLIDADAFRDYVMDIWGGGNTDNTVIWYGDVLTAISDEPTVDAVPVVHCHNCLHAEPFDGGLMCTHPWCRRFVNPDDFCSRGAPKKV